MIVIVPNPNQELQIIDFQKAFIRNNFSKTSLIYKNHLLWIPLNISTADSYTGTALLKEISSRIKEINILPPQIICSSFSQKIFFPSVQTKSVLASKVLVTTDNSIIETILPLVYFTIKDSFSIDLTKLNDYELFPVKLKIFKIAKALVLSENTRALEDSIWKKIR